MAEKYILVINEGTTGTRALIVDRRSQIKGQAYTEFTHDNPQPDCVEHDADEIWQATLRMTQQALAQSGLTAADLAAVGITNQRATTVVWERSVDWARKPAVGEQPA